MYTPYGNLQANQVNPSSNNNYEADVHYPGFPHPRGQSQNQQSSYGDFLQDPATSMAAQFAKSSLGTSNQYIQQNFGSFMQNSGNIHFYFKVSNSYVWRKLLLILCPFTNKNWNRKINEANPVDSNAPISYYPPSLDINSPDLYIPLMAFITYILSWAAFQGLQGDFHPELFGYLASQTLACCILDVGILKTGLYLLNCSTLAKLWDLLSFSSYKYVTIVALLYAKRLTGGRPIFYYALIFYFTASLSFFLMRSLRFMILPNPTAVSSASNSITTKQRRIRIQFLFFYAVIVQLIIILFLCT